jgi:hypothetical protein
MKKISVFLFCIELASVAYEWGKGATADGEVSRDEIDTFVSLLQGLIEKHFPNEGIQISKP